MLEIDPALIVLRVKIEKGLRDWQLPFLSPSLFNVIFASRESAALLIF
jgi:hypothetical protein